MPTETDDGPTDKPGYGKPPKDTQFRKGKSGNPKGRPKGEPNLKSDLREELSERIAIREGPARKRITKQRAMIKSQVNKGIQGDTRAAQLMFDLSEKHLDIPSDGNAPLAPEERAVFDASEKRRLRRQQIQSPSTQEVSIPKGLPTANDAQGNVLGNVPTVLPADHRPDAINTPANSPEVSEAPQQIEGSKA